MSRRFIKYAEWTVSLVLSATVLVLLVVRATHAGPLWRDECGSVATATLPSFSELLRYFQFESFPLPFDLTLRGYIAVAGNSDSSLRVFGALVGISLLSVGWWSARRLRAGAPLVLVTLAALNPTFLIWGTTVRGYGIGSVMIVFAFAATANFLAHRTKQNAIVMALAFVAAVQTLVSNTVLVFAICLGAIVVCLLRSDRKAAVVIAGAMGVAALSFMPYVATYFRMGWHIMLQTDVSFTALWQTLRDSLGASNPATAIAWLALTLIGAVRWIMRLTKWKLSSLQTFAMVTVLLSLIGSCVFFELLRYPPNQWYFLPAICLLASAIDLASSSFAASAAIRIGRLLVCLIAVAATCWSNWPTLIERQSNIELIANYLNSQAKARDLIVVNPWFYGVSFNRYYRGGAPWLTVPILSDRRMHRYDLMQERMSADDPLNDLRAMIESTLRNAGRIYLVGSADWLGAGERAVVLPPAPRTEYGWSDLPYSITWSQQIAEFLQAHVQTGAKLPQLPEHINPVEDVPLWEVEGWHD